jgi:hypothetical protein
MHFEAQADGVGSGRPFRARRSMSDDRGDGGLIDVSGLTMEELSAVVGESGLERALDYILASSDNGVGFHGFNSRI